MPENSFKPGYLEYESSVVEIVSEPWNLWQAGYVAWSAKEEHYDPGTHPKILSRLLNKSMESKEHRLEHGYVMEVNLWASEQGTYREMAIERVPDGFLVRKWTLVTRPAPGAQLNCYWSDCDTVAGTRLYMNPKDSKDHRKLPSIEIVFPEDRLHIYLTVGGGPA